jgi:hypothetical protein
VFSCVPVDAPVDAIFPKDRYNRPPPNSSLDFVGRVLKVFHPSLSCANAGKQKIATNNRIPATFFIDNFLPRVTRFP